MTKPKNALVKQYQTLFDMDGVELEFDLDAVRAITKKALKSRRKRFMRRIRRFFRLLRKL